MVGQLAIGVVPQGDWPAAIASKSICTLLAIHAF
jgi:hypothetical protein